MCDGCKNGDAVKCGENTCVDTPVAAHEQDVSATTVKDKVMYLQSPCGKSHMTAACHLSSDNKTVFVGLAFAPKGRFKRKDGRKVAFGRLEKGNGRFASVLPFTGRSVHAVVEVFNNLQAENRRLKNDLKVCEELFNSDAARTMPEYRADVVEQYEKTLAVYNETPSAWRNLQMRVKDDKSIVIEEYMPQ